VITTLIQTQSQYDRYVDHILQVLSISGQLPANQHFHRLVDERNHILRPNDIALPEAMVGCCYLLISTRNLRVTYIGQTIRPLAIRVHEHNMGNGSQETKDLSLRPWGLLAFVTGFDNNRDALLLFEQLWQQRRLEMYRHMTDEITSSQIIQEGRSLFMEPLFATFELRMVVKGTIQQI
jgi:predicted GIY-YIG superfamily endonuclease